MRLKVTCLFVLALALAACATGKSDPFTPEMVAGTEGAIVYVYRPPALLAGLNTAAFEIDKKPAGKIKPGGHLKIPVEPGTHTVGWRERAFGLPLWGRSIKVPVKPGESYYVRADWTLETLSYTPNGPTPIFGMTLTLVPDQQAIAELQQKKN